MPDKAYRVTANPEFLEHVLPKAKHIIVKSEDGSFFCQTHEQDAHRCLALEIKDDVVWNATMDGGKYTAVVVRLAPYHGYLLLTREETLIFAQEVGISYDAPFGPDVEDELMWRQLCETAADKDYAKRGETPPK